MIIIIVIILLIYMYIRVNLIKLLMYMKIFRMYSHAWRRSAQQLVLWKKGEQTIKQPVAVSDVVNGIVNAMLDRSTSGKIYQAVGYVKIYF